MRNGWWVSTRREEDANLHTELLRQRDDHYSARFLGACSLWFLATIGVGVLVDFLDLPGIVTLAASLFIAVVAVGFGRDPAKDRRYGRPRTFT